MTQQMTDEQQYQAIKDNIARTYAELEKIPNAPLTVDNVFQYWRATNIGGAFTKGETRRWFTENGKKG